MRKKKTETLTRLKRELWKYFSPYIRLRDCLRTTGTKEECICINCGKRFPYAQIQAGHFLPAGKYNVVRYNEVNVNGECTGCNCFDKFKLSYEANLKRLHGSEAVEGLKLHAQLHPVHQWKREEIKALIVTYREKLCDLTGEKP